jgi:hypothetical protein
MSSAMSSDTFSVHVLNIDHDKVEFLCATSTAGGLNDYAVTRSFALMIIEDGMPYVSDGKGTPLQHELRKLAGVDTPPVWDASFHKEHVHKFIAKAKLVERMGIITDIPAWQHGRFELEDDDNYPLHKFIMHVQVTDPVWLKGLKNGAIYGTTAFDAWWEDPTRQSLTQLAAIERKASKWKPPGKASEKTAPGTKSSVKKGATPVKKTAAKKTAAKKTAAK